MCKWRARARILRIGICRSEQKRSCGAKTADYPEKGDKSLLREDHSLWHSTSMHSGKNQFGRDGALPSAAALLMAFCFRFPTH